MTTRRQLLGGAAAAAAIAVRAPTAAHAISSGDNGLLEVLVAYHQEAVFAYEVALANAPLEHGDQPRLEELRDQARTATAALRKVLGDRGGSPPASRAAAEAKASRELAKRTDRQGYLRGVIGAEEQVVGGWYVALQALDERRLISGTAAFMAQGGRRLVALRRLAGQPLLPRAFETGGL